MGGPLGLNAPRLPPPLKNAVHSSKCTPLRSMNLSDEEASRWSRLSKTRWTTPRELLGDAASAKASPRTKLTLRCSVLPRRHAMSEIHSSKVKIVFASVELLREPLGIIWVIEVFCIPLVFVCGTCIGLAVHDLVHFEDRDCLVCTRLIIRSRGKVSFRHHRLRRWRVVVIDWTAEAHE